MAAGLPDATSVCVYGTYPAVHLIPKPSDATSEGFFVAWHPAVLPCGMFSGTFFPDSRALSAVACHPLRRAKGPFLFLCW